MKIYKADVPYVRVRGKDVMCNGFMWEAFGFTGPYGDPRKNLIGGCGHGGYYLPGSYVPGTKRQKKQAFLAALDRVDWRRVVRVQNTFDVKLHGVVTISDKKHHFITETRYMRLLRACRKMVSFEQFEKEVAAAVRFGTPKQYGFGSL